MSLDEYHEWLVEIRGVNIGSLEYVGGEDEGRDMLQFVSDKEEDWPSALFERAELEKLLASAIEKMPEVERNVLGLYYHKELTLREIAGVMDLHESRVSQLKSQAVLRLRTYMGGAGPGERGTPDRSLASGGHRRYNRLADRRVDEPSWRARSKMTEAHPGLTQDGEEPAYIRKFRMRSGIPFR